MAIFFAILIFSFIIFIHELGHFLVAKASGVQVNEFALFMGPAIFKWQKGETLYSIRCIPIGGYCAMEGEDKDTDNPRAYMKAAWWKRLCIVLTGPIMNFITGFLLFAVVMSFSQGFAQPVITEAEPGNTVVYEQGLHVGDRLVKINGSRVYVSSDATLLFNIYEGENYDLVVKRDGKRIELQDFPMERHEFANDDGTTSLRYGIRFGYEERSFGSLISYTWNNCLSVVQSVWLSLRMMVAGQVGINDMTGPVGLVQIMSNTAKASATTLDAVLNLLYFGAFISVNLAVMNLLPIPALDGGRAVALLLTVAIETVTRKKIDSKYEGWIHGIGMLLLLGLTAVILLKDIFVIFKG